MTLDNIAMWRQTSNVFSVMQYNDFLKGRQVWNRYKFYLDLIPDSTGLEPRMAMADERTGAFLVFENSKTTNGWLFPNTNVRFDSRRLGAVFPGITEQIYKKTPEAIAPKLVVKGNDGTWRIAEQGVESKILSTVAS